MTRRTAPDPPLSVFAGGLAAASLPETSASAPSFGPSSPGARGGKASSSIGRAPVSKTGGWGFDPLLACHPARDPRWPAGPGERR